LTLHTYSRLIKQLQEEKITYECHAGLPVSVVPLGAIPAGGETTPACLK
jgi:hypothetical protein